MSSKCPRVKIYNIVITVNLGVQNLDLKKAAIVHQCSRVIPEKFCAGTYRTKDPESTGLLFATGRAVITGTKTLEEAICVCHQYVHILWAMGRREAQIVPGSFEIRNIVSGAATDGFSVDLQGLYNKFSSVSGCTVYYEPETFPGAIFRRTHFDPFLNCMHTYVVSIFLHGAFIITGERDIRCVQPDMDWVYEYVIYPFRTDRRELEYITANNEKQLYSSADYRRSLSQKKAKPTDKIISVFNQVGYSIREDGTVPDDAFSGDRFIENVLKQYK